MHIQQCKSILLFGLLLVATWYGAIGKLRHIWVQMHVLVNIWLPNLATSSNLTSSPKLAMGFHYVLLGRLPVWNIVLYQELIRPMGVISSWLYWTTLYKQSTVINVIKKRQYITSSGRQAIKFTNTTEVGVLTRFCVKIAITPQIFSNITLDWLAALLPSNQKSCYKMTIWIDQHPSKKTTCLNGLS